MSNKAQLQTNNTKYASLIDTLRGKSLPTGGEDVTTETNAYTTKLASLESAIAALESELEGKSAGGSGSANVETCTVTFTGDLANLYVIGTFVNADGSFDGATFPDGNEHGGALTLLKGSVLSIVTYGWSHNLTQTVATGVDFIGNYCDHGVYAYKLIEDTASFEVHYWE